MNEEAGEHVRARLVEAAAKLLAEQGLRGTTIRAVAQAAGVQPPAIYRTFGDKEAMLDAVAEVVFSDYLVSKNRTDAEVDPVQQLRDGFDRHVDFGLAHPAVFAVISTAVDGRTSRVLREGLSVLAAKVRLAAGAGRLKVSEEHAVGLLHAMGTGTVLMLVDQPEHLRRGLAMQAREAVMSAILDDDVAQVDMTPAVAASTFRAHLGRYEKLSPGERHLMDELLARLAGQG